MLKAGTTLLIQNDMPRLVLTRKVGETIIISKDDEVVAAVKVSRVEGQQVRLTFEADKEVKILRKELSDGRKQR